MQQRLSAAAIGRLAIVFLALLLYGGLLLYDARLTYESGAPSLNVMPVLAEFGFSALTGFIFLASGLLVFLYLRSRWLGALIFLFCGSVAITFAMETAEVYYIHTPFFTALITDVASSCALFLFDVLLLIFPVNYLSSNGKERHRGMRFSYLYLATLIVGFLAFLIPTAAVVLEVLEGSPYRVGSLLSPYFYPLSGLFVVASFLSIFLSHRQASSPRERQQARLLLLGIALAYTPFLLGTLLPLSVPALNRVVVEGQITTIAFSIIPVALCYAVLRYQLLVVDRYIRRAVTVLVGAYCLAMGTYLVFLICSGLAVILATDAGAAAITPMLPWGAALGMVALISLVWKGASLATERLFAPELSAVHRLLYEEERTLDYLPPPSSSLESVARTLMSSACALLKTRQTCFLALHKESGSYYPIFPGEGADGRESAELFRHLARAMHGGETDAAALDARMPIIPQLMRARHPLLLSGLGEPTRGRRPRLLTAEQAQDDPLLVPVCRNGAVEGGELLGVLVLGARDGLVQYAGPDFAVIELLLHRLSWPLEMAFADALAGRHVEFLTALSSASMLSGTSDQPAGELFATFASAAARGIAAGVEIWLFDEEEQLLRRVVSLGDGPTLPNEGVIRPRASSDWACWFYECSDDQPPALQEPRRPSVLESPSFPFAWLPLQRGQHRLGVLVLTYPGPCRFFAPAERQLLELFANHLATALENTRIGAEFLGASMLHHSLNRRGSQDIQRSLGRMMEQLGALQRLIDILLFYDLSVPPEAFAALTVGQAALSSPESVSMPVSEAFDQLSAVLAESVEQVSAFVSGSGHEAESAIVPPQSALERVIRRQINAILTGFGDEEGLLVLVITPDADYAAMFACALSLQGYRVGEVASCAEAITWMGRQAPARRWPSLVLLDLRALGLVSVSAFAAQLHAGIPHAVGPVPLLLLDMAHAQAELRADEAGVSTVAPLGLLSVLQLVEATVGKGH